MNDDDLSTELDQAFAPVKGYKKEHELHRAWIESGKDPEHLTPLLNHYRPVINRYATQYGGGAKMVNQDALNAEMTGMAVKAFDTWDPDKAALTTHVVNNFQPAKRSVVKAQNAARIPESDAFLIGKINRASAHLESEGNAATDDAIGRQIGVRGAVVARVRKRAVRDIPTGAFEVDSLGEGNPRDMEIQPLIREQLSAHDQAVFDQIYHPEKPKTRTGEIAKTLGRKDYDVSGSKTRIAEQWKRYR